jgi:hypothetical protein
LPVARIGQHAHQLGQHRAAQHGHHKH